MGFLERTEQKSSNPTSRFLEWKSNDKCFSYYDKEKKENILVKTTLTFLVLEEYHTVKGFSDSDQSGIYSNEVLEIGSQEMEVKTFKGRIISKGLYNEIKENVKSSGGVYHKSIYAVTKEGELINLSLKGACVAKWGSFIEKGAWKRLKDEWVTIDGFEDHKKGMVNYSTPNFKFDKSLSNNEFVIISEKAKVFEDYINNYLDKKTENEINVKDFSSDDLDF